MFHKLKNPFTEPIYLVTNGLKTFTGVDGKGIDYKKIWSPDAEKLLSVVPFRYWEKFHLTVMTINSRIPPHTDSDIETTINFYLKTDNCRTVFYKLKTDNPKTHQIENQTDGFLYEDDDVEEVDSFIAKPMEAWVLNTKKIHSVEPDGELTMRKAVTLGTHLKFDDVCEMLRETGNL
jgi:hypothetical protein